MSLVIEKISKICSKCGEEKSLDSFGPHKRTKDKKNSWCRNCNRINMQERRNGHQEEENARARELYKTNGSLERTKKWNKEHKTEKDAYAASPRGRFFSAKGSAAFRKLPWLLSLAEYESIVSNLCYYCNGELPWKGSGLDRIDNNPLIGYRVDNVVPCCATCNYMRQESTVQEFKDQIIKIAKNLRLL
jgi:hypothetical protein